MQRFLKPGLTLLTGLCLAVCACRPEPVPSRRMVQLDSPLPESAEFADYLVREDFVVVAQVESLRQWAHRQTATVRVDSVLVGAQHSRLVMNHQHVRPGDVVLAWGTWCGARGDTCSGSTVVIDSAGRLLPDQMVGVRLLLGGQSVGTPGSFERLRTRLAQLASRNQAEWLVSGSAIGLVRVTACD